MTYTKKMFTRHEFRNDTGMGCIIGDIFTHLEDDERVLVITHVVDGCGDDDYVISYNTQEFNPQIDNWEETCVHACYGTQELLTLDDAINFLNR